MKRRTKQEVSQDLEDQLSNLRLYLGVGVPVARIDETCKKIADLYREYQFAKV